MRLVGATNWRIRVPFLIEGGVEALVGAGLAIVVPVPREGLPRRPAGGQADLAAAGAKQRCARRPAVDRRRRDLRRRRRRHGRHAPLPRRLPVACPTMGARETETFRRQDRRHQPQGAARLRAARHLRVRDPADRQRGEVAAPRPGVVGGLLRASPRRRALARGPAHPALRAGRQAHAPAAAAPQAPAAPSRDRVDRARHDGEEPSLVPLRVYFTHGIAKVEIATARGKRQHEKRQSIAKRDAQREAEQRARAAAPVDRRPREPCSV